MAVQINVAANQAALTASIQAGVQAYNQRFAQNNQLNLTVNQRAFSQPLGRMTGDVKDFEAALAASNARVIAFGASTAVLGGVIRSFKELASVTIEVEKNLVDINRVFGLTTAQLQKFSTDLFSVSKQTASSFDDASKAALEFSRQGLKAEDTLQRTKDALTLTRLAGISTANAVDALTSTVNGFAATGVTTTQILNKLVAVEQDYAVGAGDLAEALSRTGQAAQEAGVGLDQLNALVTAAQQSTARGGAVIGNALKTIFTRLQRNDTLDQLEAFNIAVRDVQGNILPAVTILQNFAGAYKNLADAQRAQLSEQVAGVYQVNILKAIVNDLNKSQGVYAGALQRGASATNEAEIATAKLNQTLDALLKQTATSTQQLANNIGKVTFEPLAKYGTEQLKSFVESMNEILEGEGVGSTFANGLLKGIRNVIAGPGAIAAFFTLFKLIQNSFTYLGQALPQIAGITTETQNRKNIEQSILQIMQQQGPVSQALAGTMGNQAAQAQLLLQVARQQTAEYQMQTTLAKQLAVQLAGQGVRVKGSGGLQVTRSGGYIPASTKMAEVVGAKAGGYSPGRVVSSPVGGVMNTAEDVKYIPGFAQPFINPPAGSKAGRKHRQNAISRTGVDPYMAGGFIPNFTLPSIYEKEYGLPLLAGRVFESLLRGDDYISLTEHRILADIDKGPFAAPPKEAKLSGKAAYNDKNLGIGKPKGSELALPLTAIKDYDEKLKDRGINISRVGYTHPELFAKAKEIVNREKGNKNTNISRIKLFDGFIPNFATPMTTASIPWFKKYSSKYKNASGDTDLFKMGDFPTYGRGLNHEYAKKGNSAMLSYLHEDFVRSALNIALGSKKVIRPAEVGFKNKPVSDIANENDFDLLYRIADGSYSMLELKQDFKNISGSVTGFMNKKLANLEKENPALAKKVSSMIAVSNRPKFTDATGRNAGANFSEFEMAAASIVKDKYSNVDPSISAKLTKVTDGLLRRYEAKKNISSGGFIPNFAKFKSRFGTATLGKTDPIDLEFFGKTLGRKIKPSDIVSIEDLTTKGKGNASNLYGDIANSIKGKGGIFGYALAQNRSVDSSKVKDPLARLKAKYPQIAKRIGLGGETFISGDYGQNIVKASTMQDLVKYQDQILKMVDPAVLTLKSFANGFIPNFASRREMFRDLIKFNLDSAPNNQNILGGKTTLFRGVRNNKNSIFGQSRNYSQTENSRDYFRNTDIDKIANDHISEKKLLPFVSASTDKDIAEYFARGRRDDNLLGSGAVGSKTIKNSRIFSEQSIRKFIDKYGEKALKDIMLELSNWGSLGYGKGMAINFQSFSQKKGFEGTDFAKEISFLSNGFIPNLASGTDIYKGYAFNNTGKIYNDLYHSDAWDSIEGSTAGAIKYAYHNNKLLLQTNKAISPILKKAFLSRGVPESAFSPVEDVDSMMRSKNKQEIDDKLKNLGSVQLSSGIQAILEKGYYRKLIKGQQFYNIPGGVSPEELKIFGGVDGWVKYQEQNYGPLKWGSYASGFIPNLANFIDVDTLGKNSVHYSGDLMKLIKDIEASIGRNLSSGELRFLTNPKTNLSKLNDPKVLNKFINSERKGGFAGFANGFVPNFAYKQAVMGLEESMSGNKAIFDTKPFPHIRNSSQPTFSSAISDHGGLGNALSDSMRGQKAAGLMNKGFIPNFVKYGPSYSYMPSGVPSGSSNYYPSGNPNKSQAVSPTYQAPAAATNATFQQNDIDKALQDFINSVQAADQKLGIFESTFGGRTKIIDSELVKLKNTLSKGGVSGSKLNEALDNASKKINSEQTKLGKALEKSSTTLAIAGPLIAGQLEQLFFANKKRTELSETERAVQSGLSTGLTSISTGASIGAAFGPLGAGIGAATGALVGLTSALSATKLSAEELADLNQEQAQKAQANITAASSYIEAQKSLTQMIASGASSSDIENASKKLAVNFKEIEDVKLQEIFNSTGGDVKKMTEELQKYSNEISRRSAFQKGIIEKTDVKTTVQALSIGIPKQNKKDVIEGFRKAASFSQSEMQYEQAIKQAEYGSNRKNNEGKTYKEVIDEAEKFRKENIASSLENFIPRLLDIGGITKDDPQYKSEFDNALKKFKSLPPEKLKEIADSLEKADLVSGVSQSINRLDNVATKSFNQIFLEIEQRIAKTAFDISLNFERDSGQRRVQSAILDFSINFQDSINSFLSNNLPDARKFDFTAATAGQKAQLQLQKSQQDYDKAIAEQANERSMFLNKSTKDLTETFKSSFLPSQASAQFFQQNVLSQLESGTFAGDAKSLAKQMQTKAFTEAQAPVKAAGFNLNNINNVDAVLKQITDKMEAVSTSAGATSGEYIKLESALGAIKELQKQTALYTNDNDVKKLQNAVDAYMNEKALFDLKQANAKKELEINKQLNEARIAVEKDIAIEKAKVDKENLMRMESMKDLSATIGNNIEIAKARSAATVNAMQRRLEDQRETFGMGRTQISERKFGIQADILKEQRAAEDAAINAEIQQRVLEMAAEQENTAATLKLNDTIMTLIETQLRGALGGEENIKDIQAMVYEMGESAQSDVDLKYGKAAYSQYQALQRIQESRVASAANNTSYNTSDFSAKMQAAGFNDRMNQAEQLTFLEKEEAAARTAGNVVLAGTIKRYQDQIKTKQQALQITRADIDAQVRLNTEIERTNNTFAGRFRKGWGNLTSEADDLVLNLGENLPKMFGDGLVDGIKAAIRESNNLGEALMGIASKFLDSISTTLMQSAVYGILGSIGVPNLPVGGKQRGGIIRAQSGMYISGTGSGDKYPALLENGEYVLNRKAVMAMGGPAELDKLNFSMAPRFASGGSFSNKFEDISSMEANMTTEGLEQSQLYNELRDIKRQEAETARQKKRARRQQMAGLVGSVVAGVVTAGIGAGISNKMQNVQAGKAMNLSAKLQTGQPLTNAESLSIRPLMDKGLINPSGLYTGPSVVRTGFSGFSGYGGRQVGGSIGSRLSDTIPSYATGGLFESPIVKRYAVGGASPVGLATTAGNSSTVNNNTNANNSFSFNTTVQRDGKIQVGANTTSYAQQDVELSQNLNNKVYEVILDTIRKEKRFGGSLAGVRNS